MSEISVRLFRISSDSKFIDCIFDCPFTEYFNYFELEVRHMNADNKFVSEWFDLSPALFDVTTREKKHWTTRIPLVKLGINVPGIYIAHLKTTYYGDICKKNGSDYNVMNKFGFWELNSKPAVLDPAHYTFTEGVNYNSHEIKCDGVLIDKSEYNVHYFVDRNRNIYYVQTPTFVTCVNCPTTLEGSETTMICSDVNQVYHCILGDLLNRCDPCKPLDDEIIIKYLMLYGHQASLTVEDIDTAELYFKQLANCFNICSKGDGSCHGRHSSGSTSVSHCNCGK